MRVSTIFFHICIGSTFFCRHLRIHFHYIFISLSLSIYIHIHLSHTRTHTHSITLHLHTTNTPANIFRKATFRLHPIQHITLFPCNPMSYTICTFIPFSISSNNNRFHNTYSSLSHTHTHSLNHSPLTHNKHPRKYFQKSNISSSPNSAHYSVSM